MALCGAAVAAFALPAHAADVDGPQVAWKFSTWGKERAFTVGVHTMAELLSEKTGGNFTVEIFYGEALSKARENLDGLKANAFEMAHFCNFYHPQKNPALMVLTMPFLPLGDWQKNVAVRDAVYAHPAIVDEMAKWNAQPYVSSYLPQYEFMGKGKPPMELADWKGLRVRAGGGIGEAMDVLGATRMTTTATEVYTAVQRGTMDAASFPMTYSHVAYKIHEVTDWYTANLSPGTSDCPVVFNRTAYEKLPAQYKKLLADIRPAVVEAQIQAYVDIDKKNYPMLEAKLKKVVYSDAQIAAFREAAGKPVIDKWIKENQDKFDARGLVDLIMLTAGAS
jgi:TRAP-type mannitol/chloroaromatic compound transport system substrate-binding protein